jgi:hypothetical protein
VATLTSIKEFENEECRATRKQLPLRPMKLYISKHVGVHAWHLLYAAESTQIVIEAEVRVALLAHNQKPSYLELRSLINIKQLRENFDAFCEKVQRMG